MVFQGVNESSSFPGLTPTFRPPRTAWSRFFDRGPDTDDRIPRRIGGSDDLPGAAAGEDARHEDARAQSASVRWLRPGPEAQGIGGGSFRIETCRFGACCYGRNMPRTCVRPRLEDHGGSTYCMLNHVDPGSQVWFCSVKPLVKQWLFGKGY